MEHRYSLRAPCRIAAHVGLPQGPELHATIRNLSMDGLYLELSDPDHPLPINSPLRVRFTLPGDGARPCTLDACVVHRDAHGFGLMLRYTDPPTLRCLEALLQAPASPPSHLTRICA